LRLKETPMSDISLQFKPSRIEVADALRGFALVSIVLLHHVERYDFYYFPEGFPPWLKSLENGLWESVFFLFSGKSYAFFALLFGFCFFIQYGNQAKKGLDFRGRYLWRLFLLLLIGIFNSLLYSGDILGFYAILGVILLPVCRWGNRAVLITDILFILQPWIWVKIVYITLNPGYIDPGNLSEYYFGKASHYFEVARSWNLHGEMSGTEEWPM
jgi:uncharacterized protein